MPPFVTAICVSFGRTARLAEAMACFMAQDYSGEHELIVLNTFPGQTLVGDFPRVKIVNCETRPPSLGAARNIAIEHARGDYVVIWDDDDLYLPNHISAFAKHFKAGIDWVWLNKQFYAEQFVIRKLSTGTMNVVGFSKASWANVGKYSEMTVGEDREFVGKLTSKSKGIKVNVDSRETSFIYSWGNNVYHTSGLGDDGRGHPPAHVRIERDLEQRIKKGQEPTGAIMLKPVLEHDPRSMVTEFLKANGHLIPKKTAVCIVELGRFGDICNILPVAEHIHNTYGKPFMMVSRQFASILDGVSYVEPFIVDLDNANINEAMALAKETFQFVIQAQIWGKDYVQDRQCRSYNEESWRMCGMLEKFGNDTLRPQFDRRDFAGEEALATKLSVSGKPLLLVNVTKSISSPFPGGKIIFDAITEAFSAGFEVIDLSELRAPKIYDVIGLMDRAVALVAIDTVHLHLSAASDVPTVAIVNPTPWAGSVLRANCSYRISYTQAERDPQTVVKAVMDAAATNLRPPAFQAPVQAPSRRLVHVSERHEDANAAESRRKEAMQRSWDTLYSEHNVMPVHVWDTPRTAQDIGDRRALPYLKDVLQAGLDQCGDDDIVFWTNDDNWLHPGLPELLRFHCSVYEACTSQRCDIRGQKMPSPYDPPEFIAKQTSAHMGRDLFAATKSWFVKHWNDIPDFILGASEFDLCLASMVRMQKGITTTRKNLEETIFPAELPRGYVCHQFHTPFWTSPNNINSAPSQLWNRKLFKEWSERHGIGLKFHANGTI